MAEICPVCNTPREPGNQFCSSCGCKFEENLCPNCSQLVDPKSIFCDNCGYRLHETGRFNTGEKQSNPLPMQQPEVEVIQVEQYYNKPDTAYQPYKDKPKKISKGLLVGIAAGAAVLVIAVVAIVLIMRKPPKPEVTPVTTVEVEKKEVAPVQYSYEVTNVIHPALYQCTDYVVYFKGSSGEEKEAVITVEIPGFTQKYEQKVTLQPQEIKMKIRPPMIEGVLNTLNTSKEAQVKVTLQDVATQKYLIQDSKPITFLSKYDMKWAKEDGSETYYQNICAWVTPEAPEIKELLRNSIDQLSAWSGGAINEIVGYQQIGGLQPYEVSYYQIAAIFETLSYYYNVRYNATPISTSGPEAQQRIALPKDVIRQQSGLCIETVVTMASAIEATGMHAMILIFPSKGHAQLAVEDWRESSEYYLVETTALTAPSWDDIIIYYDKPTWNNYLANNNVIVIDVELARKDGIKPME